jgi:hypothetical protein
MPATMTRRGPCGRHWSINSAKNIRALMQAQSFYTTRVRNGPGIMQLAHNYSPAEFRNKLIGLSEARKSVQRAYRPDHEPWSRSTLAVFLSQSHSLPCH